MLALERYPMLANESIWVHRRATVSPYGASGVRCTDVMTMAAVGVGGCERLRRWERSSVACLLIVIL